MPEISRFYGIVITMYNSEHNPPHFHIRYNDFHATMDINTGEINGNLPRRVLNLVYEWYDQQGRVEEQLAADGERRRNNRNQTS